MEPRKPRRGIDKNFLMEIDANEVVTKFFESVEPYFKVIFEENRRLTISEKNTFHNMYVHINGHTQANIYKTMMNQLQLRIKEGFEYSINLLKQYPIDENFTQHVKDELDKFDYAKRTLQSVFKSIIIGCSPYSGITIEQYISKHWDKDYYDLLKEGIQLPEDAHALFAHLNQN